MKYLKYIVLVGILSLGELTQARPGPKERPDPTMTSIAVTLTPNGAGSYTLNVATMWNGPFYGQDGERNPSTIQGEFSVDYYEPGPRGGQKTINFSDYIYFESEDTALGLDIVKYNGQVYDFLSRYYSLANPQLLSYTVGP